MHGTGDDERAAIILAAALPFLFARDEAKCAKRSSLFSDSPLRARQSLRSISPQASSRIRSDHAQVRPTISAAAKGDFSCRAFGLQRIIACISDADRAASLAARLRGAEEQPGRERPHLWIPYPRPRVGSGVAYVPAAGARNRSKCWSGNAHRLSTGIAARVCVVTRRQFRTNICGHHVLDCCAVLSAVKAASLRSAAAFRGASGLDRASAQRRMAIARWPRRFREGERALFVSDVG